MLSSFVRVSLVWKEIKKCCLLRQNNQETSILSPRWLTNLRKPKDVIAAHIADHTQISGHDSWVSFGTNTPEPPRACPNTLRCPSPEYSPPCCLLSPRLLQNRPIPLPHLFFIPFCFVRLGKNQRISVTQFLEIYSNSIFKVKTWGGGVY